MTETRNTTTTGRKTLVSIGLPVYNGEKYLRQTLDALRAQTYENFELIISDNVSTDKTPQICQEYAALDPRIKYHRNEQNLGAWPNFNRVMDLATGEYFMWAADHDHWEPEFLARCVEVLDNDPSVVLCTSEAAWIDSKGDVLESIATRIDTRGLDKFSRFQVVIWSLDNCYMTYGLIRLSALKETGEHPKSFSPDILLLTELAILGAFACIPERLFYLRRTQNHGDAAAQARNLKIPLGSWLPGPRLFCRLTWQRITRTTPYFKSAKSKISAILSLVLVMLTKYRWINHAFDKASPVKEEDSGQASDQSPQPEKTLVY